MNKLTLKTSPTLFRNLAILSVLLVTTLSSCLKGNDDFQNPDLSALSVIHASPGLQAFDFVLDGQRINSTSFDYTERLPYVSIYSEPSQFGIYKSQTTDSIKTGSFTPTVNKYYSIYVVGESTQPEFLIVADSLLAPAQGKAKVRFLNLSLNAPALNLNYGADSTLATNVSYKSHSDFIEINGGSSYNFSLTDANGNVKATSNNVPIQSGRTYTIWSNGVYNSSESNNATSLVIQANN